MPNFKDKNKAIKIIPNILTLMRIPLTVSYIYLFIFLKNLSSYNLYCDIFIILIIISDILDGNLARKFNIQSKMGTYLDTYCDLFFVLCTSILFNYLNMLQIYYTILLVFKFAEFNITSTYLKSNKKELLVFDKLGRIIAAGYFLMPFFMSLSLLKEFRTGYVILLSIGTLMSSLVRIYSVINLRYLNKKQRGRVKYENI